MIIYERPGMTDSIIDTLEKEKNARNWAGRLQECFFYVKIWTRFVRKTRSGVTAYESVQTERLRDTSLLHIKDMLRRLAKIRIVTNIDWSSESVNIRNKKTREFYVKKKQKKQK